MKRSANSPSPVATPPDTVVPALEILGVRVHSLPLPAILGVTEQWLRGFKQHLIATPNPEMLLAAARSPAVRQALNRADLAPVDGFGLLLFSCAIGRPIAHRIAGIDLAEHLLRQAATQQQPVLLFGGKPHVAVEAATRLRQKIAGLTITGYDPGLIQNPEQDAAPAIAHLQQSRPALLLVALGHGKQERFIAAHLEHLPSVRIAMGVGGALDYWAEAVSRAPWWMRRWGLEWLYRCLRQPKRFPRILNATVVFPLTAFAYHLRYGHNRRHAHCA